MFFVIFFLATINLSHGSENSTIGCVLENKKVKHVYEGWPTKMSCRELFGTLRRNVHPSLKDVGNISCIIIDPVSNKTVWSVQVDGWSYRSSYFYTSDITTNSSIKYHVNIKPSNATCYYNEILLNVTKQDTETCEINQKKFKAIEMPGRKGQMKAMHCTTPYESKQQIDLQEGVHNYNVTWFRNCTLLHPEKYPDIYRVKGKQLTLYKIDFNTTGMFSCSLTYNGQTRHPATFSVCAKPPEYSSAPVIRCPESIKAKVGQTIRISCSVNVGKRTVLFIGKTETWQQVARNESFSCMNLGTSSSGWLGRGRCFSNVSQEHNQKCYMYKPSIREQEPTDAIVNMTIEIRNVQPMDFGEISLQYKDLRESTTGKVILEYDDGEVLPSYMIAVIVLSSTVGILLIIVLVLILRKISKRQIM